MKITCPACQKRYNLDVAKIPSRVKAVRCRACGHVMPLKRAFPNEQLRQDHLRKIWCPYCGRSYSLRTDKIPSGAATVKCKSCGHPVPLKQKKDQALVHSLKTESALPASEMPEGKPLEHLSRQEGSLHITCETCRSKYKIRKPKIPPSAVAVRCKTCGNPIPLPSFTTIKAVEDRERYRGPQSGVIPEKATKRVSWLRKKKWLIAAAAGIILTIIFGILAGFKLVHLRWLNQIIPVAVEKKAEIAPILAKEPFLVINLNVPLLLQTTENRIEKNAKTLQFQMLWLIIKSLKLQRLEIYFYPDPEHQVLPVILAQGGKRQHLQKILDSNELLKKYFERNPDDTYRVNNAALSNTDKYDFTREPYQVTLFEKGAVIAPASFSGAIRANQDVFQDTPVTRFANSIGDAQDLAVAAVQLPEDLQKGWEKKIQDHPALENNPQAAMIAGMGAGIMSQLMVSLKPVEFLALGFRFSGSDGRELSYAQQFRLGVNGKAIFQKLNSGNPLEVAADGILRRLVELFQDRRYEHKLGFKDNRLAVEFSWSKKDDEAFLAALSEATIGQLFAASMELNPTVGPMETQYIDEPEVFTTVDPDTLKPKIPQMVKQSLFPGNYWNFGDQPQMTLDLDTVDIPNATLAELSYTIMSVLTPDGEDILRGEESKIKPKIHPGSVFSESIALGVKMGTPPEALGSAKIRFQLSLPVAVQVVEFNAEDKQGSVKTAGGIRVTLDRLEKDVAQISYTGAESVHLRAYDQTGKALASRESMSSASSVAARFQGVINTLKVVVADKILEYPFDVEVDLNQGRELALSRKPETPARIRYNPKFFPTYVDFTDQDLNNLTVLWKEADENGWSDSLFIQLPKGPFSGHANWEVHFFGQSKPQYLMGNAILGTRDVSFRLDKGQLKNCSAAFGKVQLNLQTDIKRLTFVNHDDLKPDARRLPSGPIVTVSFDKNEVTYITGKANVIQTSAFDALGKRLKQDNYTRTQGGKRQIYFWGRPAKFEVDIATKTIKKLIGFEIKQRPLDEKAYLAFKQSIENHREIVSTLKSMDRARRKDRSYYGDDLAGLYYLYDLKEKKPMKLVDEAIAHSDPAGQMRFSYKAKPYKGYYFSVLSGSQVNGANQDYQRRTQNSEFIWEKGTITTSALNRHPDLVAMPKDKSQPTFFLQWGQVYMKLLFGVKLSHLPENYSSKGWVEAKFIEK